MTPLATFLMVCLVAYATGSIPFGLILAKICGYGDIRTIGSGNIGATNVLRTGNKKLAFATLALDGLKGYAAVALSSHIYTTDTSLLPVLPLVSGMAAIIGHIFPVWLKFRGGKGVATAIGTISAIAPLFTGIIVLLWLATFLLSRISSLSALLAFAGSAALSILPLPQPFLSGFPLGLRAFMITVAIIIFLTHRQNIARLIRGEEHKWSKK